MEIFRCGDRGDMRRSLKTNSLVLIINFFYVNYKDTLIDKGFWHFPGMGTDPDFMQNKTLANSNETGVKLYLFKRRKNGPYVFLGRVLLAGNPFQEHIGTSLKFPLIAVGKQEELTDFLLSIPLEELMARGILDQQSNMFADNNVNELITLIKEKHIATLTSANWFLTRNGFFYNQYSYGSKVGRIEDLIKKNKIALNDVLRMQDEFSNPYYNKSMVFQLRNIHKPNKIDTKKSHLRLLSLYYNNEILFDPITFGEFSKEMGQERFYTSLLIGPNGTGKSIILSIIQKILTDAYRLRVSKKPELSKDIDYEIEYLMGDDKYKIKQENGKITFFINSCSITIKEIFLPAKLICCAFTLQDRFIMLGEFEQDIKQYEYLGIKKYIKNNYVEEISNIVAFNIMMASLNDYKLLDNLKEMTQFLGFETKIRIVFKTYNNGEVEDVITNEVILDKQKEKPELEKIYAKDINNLINETRKVRLVSLFADERTLEEALFLYGNNMIVNFNLESSEKYETLFDTFKSIWHLVDLGLLVSPSIMMCKGNKWFSIDEVSSGEFQYLSTMINILTKIEPNSLVLMDEPETSLHPTWQNRYMSQLQSIFKKFPSCHFLIATHSHFMVSDLLPESSSILTLTRNEEKKVNVNLLDENTYGRSVEDILYNVFHLNTVRNFYVESDLAELLKLISTGSRDFNKIRFIIQRLEELPLQESDPLNVILISARGYMENA